MKTGPRIYNLFPPLVGPVARWREHLPRIAAMGFDWVYLNPFHYPGFSGSLYAVKDFDRLNPLFEDQPGQDPAQALKGFLTAAAGHGIRVMMDLVVNHTAKDALLVERHPEWYLRDAAGEIRSPGAQDPDDPDKFTEWGDLAEIDWANQANHPALIETFGGIARHHAEMGFDGFRCDAAYKVPAAVWAGIIGMVRQRRPDALFAAETLGCRPEDVVALRDAGFDYLFNSVKWWDFRGDWLFEQYDIYRRIAPSIGFPESHDTERLAAEATGDLAAHYRLRAALAAFFSAGWMIPVGFEYGFARRLDVVETRPEHWEEPRFDLGDFLRDLNQAKADTPALNEEGPQERLTGRSDPVVVLLRRRTDGAPGAVLAINTDAGGSRRVDLAALLHRAALGLEGLEDIGPGHSGQVPARLMLDPLEARLFRFPAGAAPDLALPPTVTRDIAIEDVRPQIDCGRHPVKREVGDHVLVSADIFREGHDRVAAALLWREKSAQTWREARMRPGDNDRWSASFPLGRNTRHVFTIEAWPDAYETWWHEMNKKREARQNVSVEILEGRALVAAARDRADGQDRERLERVLSDFETAGGDADRADLLQSSMVRQIVGRHPDRGRSVRFDRVLEVIADRPLARFAAWYEMFHRSQGAVPGRGATLREAERRLPEIAAMGFDVLYLPPVHPIGRLNRKGPNNTLTAGPDDPGSPYAIGAKE
ncbi:MAG: DUF3416 domain-containing protein, partial [Alphaproteobacteria bacterium]|nr:DUF3416 domain-containing protein [Alphaproteobacteria bacterium]